MGAHPEIWAAALSKSRVRLLVLVASKAVLPNWPHVPEFELLHSMLSPFSHLTLMQKRSFSKIVILSESPPNISMLFWINSSARRRSFRPTLRSFPGRRAYERVYPKTAIISKELLCMIQLPPAVDTIIHCDVNDGQSILDRLLD